MMKEKVAHVIVLVVISLIFTAVCEAATVTRFEGLWKQKDIKDYLLKGKIVVFAGTRYFETRVTGTRVVAYSENGRAVSTDKAVTVDTLFSLANKRLATNEYVEVRRFDEEYGIPEWIGYGRKDVTDTGGYIEVTDFIPHPESFRPAATTYQGNYMVEDFDSLRLLLRKGDQVFVWSVTDRQLVPVTMGIVPGGMVKLAWPYVLWSNLLQKNYFISAKNLESGKIKTLTDENREDSFSFLIENRWVAWLNSKSQGYTLNLLNLEAGSNTVVSKVPFISVGNDVLLKNGRLFWIDGREIKVFQPQQGVRKLTFEPFLTPCRLLGLDNDHLYFLSQKEEDCLKNTGKVVIQHTLAGGDSQAVGAKMISPSTIAIGDNIVAWIDRRDGMDDVFSFSLKDGTERRVSYGFGHQYTLFMKGSKIIWDENRYGTRALHCYDWKTGKDETLFTCGIAEPPLRERAKPSPPGDARSLFEQGSR